MNQRITEYPVIVVVPDIDRESNEICGGDQYTALTANTKRSAFAMAKKLTNFYEVHVYEEINAKICGHWIFKNGVMTHNMFDN